MIDISAFYHWNDLQSLEQPVLVAKSHEIEFGEVEDWSRAEGILDKYKQFREEC